MTAPVTRIKDVADQILDAVVVYHGGSLPDRQYRSAGPPAWDCELVSVHCESTEPVESAPEFGEFQSITRAAGHKMRAGTFVVSIARCTPAVPEMVGQQIKLTSVDEENAASAVLYEDAQRILNALIEAEDAGELPGCNSIVFQGWTSVGPEGGFVGGEQRLIVGVSTGL